MWLKFGIKIICKVTISFTPYPLLPQVNQHIPRCGAISLVQALPPSKVPLRRNAWFLSGARPRLECLPLYNIFIGKQNGKYTACLVDKFF
jgi:hypothetical protein